MTKTVWIGLGVLLAADISVSASSFPEVQIADGPIRARLYLPDASAGFYRGTRFDWSGVIRSLEYAGHNYYAQWFQRSDPSVHDFIYKGADIVAGPCTTVTGPAEEFVINGKALGFDEAKAGGTFIKIGVGVLRKPDDDKNYDAYRLYAIQNGGKWTVTRKPDSIEFRHDLADPLTGYAYEYRKIVAVAANPPHMVLDHRLRNTGKRVIQTSVYNHNFLYLDRQAPGPDYSLTVPFKIDTSKPSANSLTEVRENHISFSRNLTGEDRVYLDLGGFGADTKDYDIRIENRRLGAGVRITADRPLSRLALWAIRAPLSIEPFIDLNIGTRDESGYRGKVSPDVAWRSVADVARPRTLCLQHRRDNVRAIGRLEQSRLGPVWSQGASQGTARDHKCGVSARTHAEWAGRACLVLSEGPGFKRSHGNQTSGSWVRGSRG